VARLRLGEIAAVAQHQAEIVVRHREPGIDGDRLPHESDPGFAIEFLIANAPRQMQGIAMRRIHRQDLRVTQRRGVELAGLVMLDRAFKDLYEVIRHGILLRNRFHLPELAALSIRVAAIGVRRKSSLHRPAPIRIAYG